MFDTYTMYNGLDYDQILQQILQGNLNIWDILNAAGSYIPGVRALIGALTVFFLLSTVIGLIQCFFGYRLFRIFAAIQGFFVGAGLFTAIGAATESGLVTFLFFLIGGIGGAVLAYRVYQIGVFLTTGCYIGLVFLLIAFVSLLVTQDDNFAILVIAFLIGFVLGGILGVLFSRPLIIISTGLSGFSAVNCLFMTLHQNTGTISWILGLLCSAAGIYYQFKRNPYGTPPGPRSRGWQEKTASSGAPRGKTGFSGAATAATGAAFSATGNLSRRLADQEISEETEALCQSVTAYLGKNKVAGTILPYAHILLYLVTAILFLTNSAELFVLPLALCLLCFASQRFEAIFISLTLLLLRALPYDLNLLSYAMGSISTWIYFCGVVVIVYLDIMALMTFLKTERGKKLVGRATEQAEAANLRQQQYAASRQAQQMYSNPVPPEYPGATESQQPAAPVSPVQPIYDEPTVPVSAMEEEIPQSYGTQPVPDPTAGDDVQQTQIIPDDIPQEEEAVSDATVRVSMDTQIEPDYGTLSQQVSSDIQEMMDPPTEPERPIARDYIFCIKCGNRMRCSDNFCTKCGARLEK
ncbi:MAG: hypothetical protein Q4F79_08775 [Eubacteriales bacterium]|nr:hypothetical protein [Eubacteriales bacterium]